ncbi:MAG: aldo/keto reductase [Pseudoxanthomonas sp.]
MQDHFDSRKIGRTGLRATTLGMGCGTLGDPWKSSDAATSFRTVEVAYAAGVRYFDTAPWYGIGKSESRTGMALQAFERSSYALSSKVGRVLHRPARVGGAAPATRGPYRHRWHGGYDFDLYFDYTRAGVLRSYEDSLQRLGHAGVDALVVHDLDRKFNPDAETFDSRISELDAGGGFAALLELKRCDDIQAIGIGINHAGLVPMFLERFTPDFFLVAMPYTLLDQDGLRELDACHECGVSVVIGAPFASGILASASVDTATYGYRQCPADISERLQQLHFAAEQHKVPLAAAALQFPLAHPAVATVIPGAGSPDEMQQNASNMRFEIPAAFWQTLRAQRLIGADAPIPLSS